jgi:hypothetical protein
VLRQGSGLAGRSRAAALSQAERVETARLDQPDRAVVAYLTDDLWRRSDHRPVQELEQDIRDWWRAAGAAPCLRVTACRRAQSLLETVCGILRMARSECLDTNGGSTNLLGEREAYVTASVFSDGLRG